ncbi:hypothetical protein R5R35_010536 [Gryllus longicercus]|uniref:Uncharacterized protein n=1 Tax=Gryllus longicercus TaxID=2509291 RepID=A0AAN9V8Q5_9ORTH
MLVEKSLFLNDDGMDSKLMTLSILNAMHYVAKARLSVTPETISNCFHKAGVKFVEDKDFEQEHLVEPNHWSVMAGSSFENYVNVDAEITTSVLPTVEEIISNHLEQEVSKDTDPEPVIPTIDKAINAITTLRQFIESEIRW